LAASLRIGSLKTETPATKNSNCCFNIDQNHVNQVWFMGPAGRLSAKFTFALSLNFLLIFTVFQRLGNCSR